MANVRQWLASLGLTAASGCFDPETHARGQGETTSGDASSTTDGGLEGTASPSTTTTPSTTGVEPTDTAQDSSSDDGCSGTDCPCLDDATCDRGLVCREAACAEVVCGDTLVEGQEQCDDGARVDGDGCDADCSLTELIWIDTSYRNTCVGIEGGRVRCWGQGGSGQNGYGTTDTVGDDEYPAAQGDLMLPAPAIAGSLGDSHACTLLEPVGIRCWGGNGGAQLGLGNLDAVGDDEYPSMPTPMAFDSDPVQIAAGGAHTCVRLQSGDVHCWGSGFGGALGYGNGNTIGDDETGDSTEAVMLGAATVWVSTGVSHTCAVLDDGDVRCWGGNGGGQCGFGVLDTIGDDEQPVAVAALSFDEDALEVSAGYALTCARFDGGDVRCWGGNASGELGQGNLVVVGDDEPATDLPPILLGAAATHVSVGDNHACAQLEGGVVRCWGANYDGQLGLANTMNVGDDEVPSTVAAVDLGTASVTALDAGGNHTCAILERHRLKCWGRNADGQLGLGHLDNIGDDETPAMVPDVPVLVAPR